MPMTPERRDEIAETIGRWNGNTHAASVAAELLAEADYWRFAVKDADIDWVGVPCPFCSMDRAKGHKADCPKVLA